MHFNDRPPRQQHRLSFSLLLLLPGLLVALAGTLSAQSEPSLSLDPSGRLAAVRTAGGELLLYSVPDGTLRRRLGVGLEVQAHAFAGSARRLVLGTATGRVLVVDTSTGQEQASWSGDEPIVSVDASADWVVSATAGCVRSHRGSDLQVVASSARALDIADSRELPLELHSLALAPDGGSVAVAGNVLELRRTDTLALVRSLRTQEEKAFGAVVFSPDGRRLAAAGFLHAVHLCIVDSGGMQELPTLDMHADAFVPLTFSADSRELYAGAELWDLELVRRRQAPPHPAGALTCTPDHRALVSLGDEGLLIQPTERPARQADTPQQRVLRWGQLTTNSPDRAARHLDALREGGDATVAFLAQRLRGSVEQRLADRFADLDAPDPWRADAARRELVEFAGRDPQRIRSAAQQASAAAQATLGGLLTEARLLRASGGLDLRERRVVQVLERIASPMALELLEELHKAEPDTDFGRDLAAAAQRVRGLSR